MENWEPRIDFGKEWFSRIKNHLKCQKYREQRLHATKEHQNAPSGLLLGHNLLRQLMLQRRLRSGRCDFV